MADHKRMTLVRDEFSSEHGGRLPAGSVAVVPDDVADRWEARGIANPSKKSDLTAREARLKELHAELEALNAEPVYDAAMTSDNSSPAERRRRLLVDSDGRAPGAADDEDEDEAPKAKSGPAQTLGLDDSKAKK